VPATARAFSEPRSYVDDPGEGGGGGRWFTGSPADGYGCSVCHGGRAPVPLYVDGLPPAGYVPGMAYDVRLSWPEFTALETTIRQTPGAGPASMSLVAEFVTETGNGSGTVEIASLETTTPGERCVFPEDTSALHLYSVKPGTDVKEEATRCEATLLEERCLLAVSDCGAQEFRFRWTAPPLWQRSIWFSTGLVATDRSTDTPDADAVTEISFPLIPAASASARYETEVTHDCGVEWGARSDGMTRPALAAFLWISILGCRLQARRARRHG